MFGSLMALIPLITQLVPALTGALTSPLAGSVLVKAGDIAEKIFGTKDPSAISAQLAQDQTKLERFKAELEAQTESEQAAYKDMESARTMQMTALQTGSATQWVPVFIAAMVFVLFGVVCTMMLLGKMPNDSTNAGMIIGAVVAAFTTAVQFFLGSSVASKSKDAALASVATTAIASSDGNGSAPKKMFR